MKVNSCPIPLILYKDKTINEPTCRCQNNPLIGALGIQEPVIPSEPLIKC